MRRASGHSLCSLFGTSVVSVMPLYPLIPQPDSTGNLLFIRGMADRKRNRFCCQVCLRFRRPVNNHLALFNLFHSSLSPVSGGAPSSERLPAPRFHLASILPRLRDEWSCSSRSNRTWRLGLSSTGSKPPCRDLHPYPRGGGERSVGYRKDAAHAF